MGRMGPGHGPLALRRGGLSMSETIHVLNAIGGAWREAHRMGVVWTMWARATVP